MTTTKKRILFLSNFSLANTGFGKAQKNLLIRLHATGKYELAELAAGIADPNPDITKLPWKVYGVLPKNNEEAHKFHHADDATKRAFQYGLFRFDEAVADFKPDVVCCHEDLWAWSGWLKKTKTYGKFIPISWAPHDAEPMSEEFAEFLKDFPYVFTYGEWSKEIAVKAGVPQAQVIPLGIEPDVFKPLPIRDDLRAVHGFKPDDYVVLMVARLQIRKKFETLFESLLTIREKDPALFERIKILPFCNFTDPAGFDVPKFWRSRKIPVEKIIAPYVCPVCHGYFISPSYQGDKIDCKLCSAKQCCHTPSVVEGVTDQQLNEIYNMADLFVLPTSNEGFGAPICEAKAAGKIAISTGYSTSKELCEAKDSGLLFPYSLYCEYGTLFYKANLRPQDVAEKIIEAFHIPAERRKEMEKNAREAMVEKWNWDVIAKQWDEILDGIEPKKIDWDAKPRERNQNPNAELPLCKSNGEWILALYKHILDTDILAEKNNDPTQDSGYKYWLWEIEENKRPHENIEKFFRETALKEVQEKNTKKLEELLDPKDGKRILYVIPASAGDNLLSTAIVSAIKKKYPDHVIYVSCEPPFAPIWKGNPHVKNVLFFNPTMMAYGSMEGVFDKGLFDICFTPTILTQRNPPSWHHGGRDIVKEK